MSPVGTARSIVDDVLGRSRTREIWTSSYNKALPVSVQDFDLSGVLPAVFFMFRFGHRRGKGKFFESFGGDVGTPQERRRAATIDRVASGLAASNTFRGFQGATERAILGDLLLCFCLENAKRALGRDQQVQRVAPAHYMSSWVDLPEFVANLRYVPEMIVAMLADQAGDGVQLSDRDERTWFPVGRGFESNVLLKAFHQGVSRGEGPLADRTADRFEESTPVGLDQLLIIRLAQLLGEAPDSLRGGEGKSISNQRPIAQLATQQFSEDIRRFLRSYAGAIPRHSLVALVESSMSVGLTSIVTSSIELLFDWAETGEIPSKSEQTPAQLFVDCSNGVDRGLRALAVQSLDDFMRRIERFPVVLMALRLLDHSASHDRRLRDLDVRKGPYATDWLNLLGELLHSRRVEAEPILYELDQKASELADRLVEGDYPEVAQMLRNDRAQPNPVWRLAESLTFLQGRKNTQNNLTALIDSALLVDRPNGLAAKRPASRSAKRVDGAKRRELRSLVFTDSVLDYLVHLQVLPAGSKNGYRLPSFRGFVGALRERYGFCIDAAPPGMTISNELLRLNAGVLERRLRDLGLLAGVNDADAMKQLRPRFQRSQESTNGTH